MTYRDPTATRTRRIEELEQEVAKLRAEAGDLKRRLSRAERRARSGRWVRVAAFAGLGTDLGIVMAALVWVATGNAFFVFVFSVICGLSGALIGLTDRVREPRQ
jgi:hypothetical protein